MPREGRRLHTDAFFERFRPEVSTPRPRRDGYMHGRAFWRYTHFLGAVKSNRADITRLELVCADDLLVRRHERFPGVRNFHHVNMRRVEQALGMFLEPENRRAMGRAVGAQALEHGESIMQRVGQNMGIRVAPGHELAVIPDMPVAVSHRHGLCAPLKTRILTYFIARCPAHPASRARPCGPLRGNKPMRVARFLDHEIDWCEYHIITLGRDAAAVTLE